MNNEKDLQTRSGSVCEMCGNTDDLKGYSVAPKSGASASEQIYACGACTVQMDDPALVDPNHWRCLNDSMWNPEPAVQVMAWRMLTRLRAEGWPNNLLEMMYLEEDTMEWAKATGEGEPDEDAVIHKDVNGVVLQAGDSVVLIKDLNVKGSSMVAKRGTVVRNIALDRDNAEYIEGRVDGQQIVIVTKYVKKSG